ncbi:MAG: peptide ABC transporter substrate-binding protein [Clostridiales bacterium]|nr:peptide ABC transporter substrate-binding protein [Clostridiales bacterium]
MALLALVALLSGCAADRRAVDELPQVYGHAARPATATPQPDQDAGGLKLGVVAAQGATADPILANERDLVSLNKLAFESLVELGDDMRPSPLLADRWSNEGGNWVFTLRSGVVFHDGQPLTAQDVLDSYNAIMAAGGQGAYFDRVQDIREMTVVDDRTLVVACKRTGYLALYAMTFPVIQGQSIGTGAPMGTGPFWYISRDLDAGLRLERNPIWWKRQASVRSVAVTRFDDARGALEAFETGEIDTMTSRDGVASLSSRLADRSTIEYSTMSYECVVPNLGNLLLADLSVRRALMYAIDRNALASTIYLDMVQESEVPVLPGSWLYETQSAKYNHSPERALQVLQEAGWADSNGDGVLDRMRDNLVQDLAFSLITYDEPTTTARHEAIKRIAEQLGRVGFKVTVATMSKANLRDALRKGSFDLALVGYNLSELPDLGFLLGSGGAGNYAGYRSDQMDGYIAAARAARTAEDLQDALSAQQLLVVEDLPIFGLFFRSGLVIGKQPMSGLVGVRESQMLRGLEFVQPVS